MSKRHSKLGGGPERLYLVFDDWHHGYSIRKITFLPDKSHEDPLFAPLFDPLFIGPAKVPCFPQPFFHMVAPRGYAKYFTSAFGTRILAMHPRDPEGDLFEGYFPMLDVRSRCVTTGPGQRNLFHPIYYLPAGNKLFTLSSYSFEMLCLDELSAVSHRYSSKEWSWKELQLPFSVDDITSYCLHPDERTFLVSTKTDTTEATFSFDTEKLSWTVLGDWILPFAGRGHFDQHLNAFVGLSKEPGILGQICCCDVPIYGTRVPLMNRCMESPLVDGPYKHVGATLVYMGCLSKFCLVQRCCLEDSPFSKEIWMYCLTTFSLSLDDQRKELTICNISTSHWYKVPEATTKSFLLQDPVAFWM